MSVESPTGAPISQSEEDKDEAATRAFIEAASKKAAAESPGIDPDAIVAKVMESLSPRLNDLLDKRVAGFQSALTESQRVTQEQASKLREYEIAGMSEDERSAVAQQERDEEVERLRLENELFRLRDKHPAGAAAYQRLLEADMSAEQQVALLDQLLTAKGEQPTPTPTPQPAVLSDRNNPANTLPADTEVAEGGIVMNEDIAMATLKATPRWPGQES